jgi:hypothetical protein
VSDGQCPSCGCYQPDNLLCHQCSSALETMFAAIPQLVDELQVAIAKQAKVGAGGKGGLARERAPINFGALAVRDELLVELALWGTDIDDIRKHPQAAEIVSGVGKAVKNAYRAIDRMQDRIYLGTCFYEEDGATCHAEVWARPGAHQVTCTQCHITHEVHERRAWLLQQAEDRLFTVREAAQMVGDVGGIRVTEDRIRGYLRRGKRLAFRPGTNLIRLGDLLAVVLDDKERKAA